MTTYLKMLPSLEHDEGQMNFNGLSLFFLVSWVIYQHLVLYVVLLPHSLDLLLLLLCLFCKGLVDNTYPKEYTISQSTDSVCLRVKDKFVAHIFNDSLI